MGGEAVPQRMNADTLGDAGTPRCHANDPMQLTRTGMLPAVAGKQPGLTGRHPALLARNAPPFVQYLEQDGRENDVPILLALALLDPDDHPVTIDIGELERRAALALRPPGFFPAIVAFINQGDRHAGRPEG